MGHAECDLAARSGLRRTLAARRRSTITSTELHALDLATCLLALRNAGARVGFELRSASLLRRFLGDEREVNAATNHRHVIDLDDHLVAELERASGPFSGQSHVHLVVLERLAERVELDEAFDVRLVDFDERT